MGSPIISLLQALLISSSKLFFLLMLLAVLLTIVTHVFISLIEKIVKIPIKPIIDSIAFPGLIMKNAWIKLTASFFGYQINIPLYTSSEKINYETIFYSKIRSPIHLFIVLFSPYMNLVLAFLLIASRSLVLSFIPGILALPYNIATTYLSISILISGLPAAQDVFLFINTMVQNSPWFFILTAWGIIAAAIMNQVLGTTPTLIFWCFYETLLILFELKNTTINPATKEPKASIISQQKNPSTDRNNPGIVMLVINDYREKDQY